MDIEKRKYPIGKFDMPEVITQEQVEVWLKSIADFPQKLRKEVEGLDEIALTSQYRQGSWTIKQLVHHCADSHLNSFIRLKLALTEDTPTVKPYDENLWAVLPDAQTHPIESSLSILDGVHARWVQVVKNLTEAELKRAFFHPESQEKVSIQQNIGKYAWHGAHHLAHIQLAKETNEKG